MGECDKSSSGWWWLKIEHASVGTTRVEHSMRDFAGHSCIIHLFQGFGTIHAVGQTYIVDVPASIAGMKDSKGKGKCGYSTRMGMLQY